MCIKGISAEPAVPESGQLCGQAHRTGAGAAMDLAMVVAGAVASEVEFADLAVQDPGQLRGQAHRTGTGGQ